MYNLTNNLILRFVFLRLDYQKKSLPIDIPTKSSGVCDFSSESQVILIDISHDACKKAEGK